MKQFLCFEYEDVEIPFFYKPNTSMLLGDVKTACEHRLVKIKNCQ